MTINDDIKQACVEQAERIIKAGGELFYIPPTQYGVSVAMLPMQKRYNEFIKSNREPTAKPLLYLRTVKRKWNIMFRKYPKRRGNYSMWP